MRAIVFDFGKVVALFDHHIALRKVQPFTTLSVAEMFQRVFESDLEDTFERGHLEIDDFLARVQTTWQARCELPFLRRALADIFEPNPEVCELIPRLAGRYRLVLGSNTNAIHAEQFLPQFADVLGHFHHLVLSYRIGCRKPERAFFEHCVAQAGCRADECVFVDDIAANVASAEAVGLRGIVYRRGDGLLQKLAAHGVV
jgi:putative hydrolase of the HAD superfamily